MTANAMQGDRQKALEAGMDDYVPKPVKREELEAILERWISRAEEIVVEAGEDTNGQEELEDPLDRSVLASLRELQEEGEPDILHELIELFLTEVARQLVALREAVRAGDARSVVRIARVLEENSANMGARSMVALCTELEEMGRSEDLSVAPALISRLEAEFGRVRVAFQKEIQSSA
jgi:HPt (histidine-containing phosphotransfer) domain-containing protein